MGRLTSVDRQPQRFRVAPPSAAAAADGSTPDSVAAVADRCGRGGATSPLVASVMTEALGGLVSALAVDSAVAGAGGGPRRGR